MILCIQGPAYMAALHAQIPAAAFATHGFWFNLSSTLILLAGSMFVMWLGERITDRGIGNGISLIIMIGIVARLPYALAAEITDKLTGTNGAVLLLERDIASLSMYGRPLSRSLDALREMRQVRGPLYCAAADAAIDNNAAPEDAVARAEEAFYEAVDR